MTEWPLRRRVALLALAYFVLVGVGQIAALMARGRLNSALEQRERDMIPAQASLNDLRISLLDERAQVLGYVLTGEAAAAAAYHRGRAIEQKAAEALAPVLGTTPHLVEQLAELELAADAWHREVAIPALAAARLGRTQEAVGVVAEHDEALFTRAIDDAGRLAGAIDERVARDRRRVREVEAQLGQLMLVGSTTAFLLSLATIVLVRRWITLPITGLSGDVRRVADGDLEHAITPTGPPELTRLGGDVEAMRRRILAELDTAIRAGEALEQGAPLVVKLRSELAGNELAVPGLVVVSRFQPAEGVLAGDWYDLVEIEHGRVALVVVDTSGHGPAAGLFSLKIKHLLIPALRLGMSPGEALAWVAGHLGDTDEQFATCLVAEVALASGACRYANAGHPPGLVFGPSQLRELGFSGPLLGPLDGTWTTRTDRLNPDELLVVYTDGLVEARNTQGEEFGVERLIDVVTLRRNRPPQTVADDVLAAVRRFRETRLADDLTLVVMGRTPGCDDQAAPEKVADVPPAAGHRWSGGRRSRPW